MDSPLTHDRFASEGVEQLWRDKGEEGLLQGLAVTYRDTPNFNGRIVVPGAFSDSLKRRPTPERPLQMGYEHSSFLGTQTIGRWGAAKDDPDKGLLVREGRISDTSLGRDVQVLIDDKVMTGLSVGFLGQDVVMGEPGEELSFDTPWGTKTYLVAEEEQHPVVFVKKGELLETSVVGAPADDDARMFQSISAQAARALPGLKDSAAWDEVAYSMALLMGGRGAGSFRDLPGLERASMYQKLAERYMELGKTPPPYDPEPEYRAVEFAHDERDVFQHRYVEKTMKTLASGLAGLPAGALSREGCGLAMRTARAYLPHLVGPLPDEAKELAREFRDHLDSLLSAESDSARLKRELEETLDLVRSSP